MPALPLLRPLKLLLFLSSLASRTNAIAWGVILDPLTTANNTWLSLSFSITVPPSPSPPATSGPWFFWAGLQPGALCADSTLGVVQPVLQWDEYSSCAANPQTNTSSWQLVQWTVPSPSHNLNASSVSCGLWASPGDVISNTVIYTPSEGTWTQKSTLRGVSVTESVAASDFFCPPPGNGSGANFFLLESELYGPSLSLWSTPITFSNITLTAQTSRGVAALCQAQKTFSDGNGAANISGGTISSDGRSCGWREVVLTPP